MSGPFGFGASVWPGVAKVIEEAGEVQQVCGKLIQMDGGSDHWDGTNLRERLQEEIADLQAALEVVIRLNDLDVMAIYERALAKRDLFLRWQVEEAAKVALSTQTPSLRSNGMNQDLPIPTPQENGGGA